MKELQAYEGPRSELAPPEQFLLAMSTVPRLTDKLNILILMQQFEVGLPTLLPSLYRRLPLYSFLLVERGNDSLLHLYQIRIEIFSKMCILDGHQLRHSISYKLGVTTAGRHDCKDNPGGWFLLCADYAAVCKGEY